MKKKEVHKTKDTIAPRCMMGARAAWHR